MTSSEIAAWVEATSSLGLGLAAIAFAWYQWRASAFNPVFDGEISTNRSRMWIEITNHGHQTGTVVAVDPVMGKDAIVDFTVVGDGKLPHPIPGGGVLMLVLQAKAGTFPKGTAVQVQVSTKPASRIDVPVNPNLDLSESSSAFPSH